MRNTAQQISKLTNQQIIKMLRIFNYTIQNYALIDTLDISFTPGFSVITGETGAGKSIILGAIGLLLGQRADIKAIKKGANKCIVEARFNISAYQMEPFFTQRDLEYDPNECIIRRELYASGKSRAFINDTPGLIGADEGTGRETDRCT